MHFKLDEKDEEFRQTVRRRIAELLPPDIKERQSRILTNGTNVEDQRRWLSILDKEGWSVLAWPVEHGGTGWTAMQRFIFEDEMHSADAPDFSWIGSHMVGPVLYTFGSEEQKERYLPPIRNGGELWAQGFSEPGAGSDLASLRTQARREGDKYIVNGSKIWTSGAHEADWLFCLVKTDPTGKPQKSISCLLIDLRTPGITVRPIQQINGEAHVCEVFLDEVEVPAENLVGEEGKGWTYAKFLLDHERSTSSFIYWTRRELARTYRLANTLTENGRPLAEDPAWARRLAYASAQVETLRWSVLRVLAEEPTPYPISAAASVLKLKGSELQQTVTTLQVDLLGELAIRDFGAELGERSSEPNWPDIVAGRTGRALITRAATIYGGTQQIQKNILAKLALGL